MSMVNLTNVAILDNPSSFFQPFSFEITFEVFGELAEDLEFKVTYVGSAESEKYDQVLEAVMVGPVPVGVNKFVLQADPPKPELLPPNDVLEVTIVLLTVSYREKEFIRVGYYVHNDYRDEHLRDNPPEKIQFELLERTILADQPRVTRYNIPWDGTEAPMAVEEPDISLPFKAAAMASGFGLTPTPLSATAGMNTPSAGSEMVAMED